MNLQEYLRDFVPWPKTLSKAEFEASGIPDMGHRWLKRFRYMEVNVGAMRAAVAATAVRRAASKPHPVSTKTPQRATVKPSFAMPAQLSVTVKVEVTIKKSKRAKKCTHAYANDPAFLNSFEWRQLRFEALRIYGRQCQCCGASPATGAVMHVDHVKPRRKFPELALDINNLQVLCAECNHGKCNEIADFRGA